MAHKIMLVLVLFVILPMVAVGGGWLRYVQTKADRQAVAHLDSVASAVKASLSDRASDLTVAATALADETRLSEALYQGDPSTLTRLLAEKRQAWGLSGVAVIDRDRNVVATDGEAAVASANGWLIDAGWQGQTRSSVELGLPVIFCAVAPIYRAGEVAHLLQVTRRLPESWVADLRALSGVEISLIQSGERVETTLLTPAGEKSVSTAAFVPDPRPEIPFYRHRLFEQTYFVRYESLSELTGDDSALLEVAVPSAQATAITDSLSQSLWLVVAAGLVFGGLGVWMLARHLVMPLQALYQAACQIAAGDLSKRLAVNRRDEWGELARAFNEMIYSLWRSREKQLEINRSLEAQIATRTGELAAVLRSAGDAIITLDSQARITSLNPAAEALLECDAAHALHRPADKIWTYVQDRDKDDEFEQDLTSVQRMLVTRTGRHIPVSVSRAPLRAQSGRQVGEVLIMRDVSREYEIDRMKTEFVSLVSHEFRAPLSTVRGYAELLADDYKNHPVPEVKQWLQVMVGNIDRLVALTNDILDIARIESGQLTLHPSSVALPSLIERVAVSMQPMLDAKEQTIDWQVSNGLVPVQADRDRVLQVLTNLVSNAHKYTLAGGHIVIQARLVKNLKEGRKVSARFPSEVCLPAILVSVADTGVGISEADQKKLFTRFFRAQHPATREVKGTGLGLTVTKLVLKMHQGDIWVDSRLDEGSTFFFTLPVEAPDFM
jgi:PAS domain S-box-containing protein